MGNTQSPTAERPGTPPAESTRVACGLTERHFVLQADRPDYLGNVDTVTMDPYLRGLLFTDGTVTRTLEVQTLSPVSVEVLEQRESPATGEIAARLEVPAQTAAIRRRTVIGVNRSPQPVIWAESHIVPDRLPHGFLGVLHDSPDGIGQSLEQMRLESAREMLWFGLDVSPAWGQFPEGKECTALVRLYRVVTQGRPAMLISESFAIECHSGTYRLAGW